MSVTFPVCVPWVAVRELMAPGAKQVPDFEQEFWPPHAVMADKKSNKNRKVIRIDSTIV